MPVDPPLPPHQHICPTRIQLKVAQAWWWETRCHSDRCGTSRAAEITIKSVHQHDSDLCYDADKYKLLSVNWHQRKDKSRIRGWEVGGGFSYNCLTRNGFYYRRLLGESNLNSALSSSRHVLISFAFVLTLNPDVRTQLDQKIHMLKQCHKYKDAISVWSESENRDTDQKWNLIWSLAAFLEGSVAPVVISERVWRWAAHSSP